MIYYYIPFPALILLRRSCSGILKPNSRKYGRAPVDSPRYTVRPPMPSSSTLSNKVKSE